MNPDSKLLFTIKLNGKVMSCKVISEEGDYYIQLDDIDIATIRLNDSDKWIQLKGRRLTHELIEEIGSNIEALYRERLFADN